jgi:hypothetical protein
MGMRNDPWRERGGVAMGSLDPVVLAYITEGRRVGNPQV